MERKKLTSKVGKGEAYRRAESTQGQFDCYPDPRNPQATHRAQEDDDYCTLLEARRRTAKERALKLRAAGIEPADWRFSELLVAIYRGRIRGYAYALEQEPKFWEKIIQHLIDTPRLVE